MAGGDTLLMFGDSSGNPSMAKGGFVDSRHFIVGTITMGASEAHRINEEILGIKRRYFSRVDPVRVEFHGNSLRKMLNRHTGNRARADSMLQSILDDLMTVVADSEAFVNMVIMDKVAPSETFGHVGVISKSWAHAADMFRQNLLHSGSGLVGIPILDRYEHAENKIVSRAVAQSLEQLRSLVQDTGSRAILHPIFVDSRSSNIIQLVDILTYITSRHIGRGNDDEFAKRHRQLLPRIDRIINAKPWQHNGSGGPA